jgi:hypothetical protein
MFMLWIGLRQSFLREGFPISQLAKEESAFEAGDYH